MPKRAINSPKLAKPMGPFTHGIEVPGNRLLFLSGVVGRDGDGLIRCSDILGQTRQCFDNLRLVIEEAGGSLSDLVKITTFIRNWDDYPGFNEVRQEILRGVSFASSTVQCTLFAKEALVEIEAVASLP